MKPESLRELIEGITPEIYQKLKTAVELGKWESGERLSKQQTENCLQAIIAYEHQNLPVNERTGFIDPDSVARNRRGSGAESIASDKNLNDTDARQDS